MGQKDEDLGGLGRRREEEMTRARGGGMGACVLCLIAGKGGSTMKTGVPQTRGEITWKRMQMASSREICKSLQ